MSTEAISSGFSPISTTLPTVPSVPPVSTVPPVFTVCAAPAAVSSGEVGELLRRAYVGVVRHAARRGPLRNNPRAGWRPYASEMIGLSGTPAQVCSLDVLALLTGVGVFEVDEVWKLRMTPEAFEAIYAEASVLQDALFEGFANHGAPPHVAAAWGWLLNLSPYACIMSQGALQLHFDSPHLAMGRRLDSAQLAWLMPLAQEMRAALLEPLRVLRVKETITLQEWLPAWELSVAEFHAFLRRYPHTHLVPAGLPALELSAHTRLCCEELRQTVREELIARWLVPCGLLWPVDEQTWRVDTAMAQRVLKSSACLAI